MRTNIPWIVTTVALLASAALGQDPPAGPPVASPPAPNAPVADVPRYVISLPDVPDGATREAGVPTALVAVGGFLVATTDPTETLRVDGRRVLRTRGGVETVAAVRLAEARPGCDDDPAASMSDAAARSLSALDIDAARPDFAAWLARIDPVRCAVRVRMRFAAVVPKLPESLQLVEVVAEGPRGPGCEALPALASARRIAVYGFDFANAEFGGRGDTVEEHREAGFRAAHEGALVVTSPRAAFDGAVAGCDLVRVRTGGLKPRVLDVLCGAEAGRFVADLEFDDRRSFDPSPVATVPPPARCVLEFLRADRVLARAELAPSGWTDRFEWTDGPWPGAVALRAAAGREICNRLRELGASGPDAYRTRQFARSQRRLRDHRQSELLGEDATRRLRDADAVVEPPATLRDPAVALRVLGCSGGHREDRVSAAASQILARTARDEVLAAAAANAADGELQLGFALWMWDLPDRDFLAPEQRPLLEQTARRLGADNDMEVLCESVRPLRELKLVEPLRRVLAWGRVTVLPYASQVEAAAALVDLGDAESLPQIRALRDASEDPEATAALDAILARAAR